LRSLEISTSQSNKELPNAFDQADIYGLWLKHSPLIFSWKQPIYIQWVLIFATTSLSFAVVHCLLSCLITW
jgi:hypothetical protein